MDQARSFLSGYKTYIAAVILALTAVVGFIDNELTAIDAAFRIAEALGIAGFRHAAEKLGIGIAKKNETVAVEAAAIARRDAIADISAS